MKQTACQRATPNFETLVDAFANGHVMLVEGQRVSDNKPVALLCASHMDGENMTHFIPLAVMIDESPYEAYRPPNEHGGFWPTESEELNNAAEEN